MFDVFWKKKQTIDKISHACRLIVVCTL